jgi:UPF0755 protein
MSRRRHIAIVVLGLVVLPLVVLASGAVWFWFQIDPPGPAGARVEIQIERGWGVPRIAKELSRLGVIDKPFSFELYARLRGDSKFDAGTYVMHKHMGDGPAINVLKSHPRPDYVELTVPPGLWLTEIGDRVAALGGRNKEAFLDAARNNAVRSVFEPANVHNLEGLLWPDTYQVSDSEDEISILKTMAKTFDERAIKLGLANANVRGFGPYDILKVASLIESEAKIDSDRPKIASVIYNRLAQHMNLQVDATLIYARRNPKNRSLSDADKQIASPYNTYLNAGLPPTPIAAVSEKSLRAALAPVQSDYLYYVVVDKAGGHAFASTYAEHQANIERARKAGVL